MVALVTPAVERYSKKDMLSSAPKASVAATVRGIAAEEGLYGVCATCVGVGLLEPCLLDGPARRVLWPGTGGVRRAATCHAGPWRHHAPS